MLHLLALACLGLACLTSGEYQHPMRNCQVENSLTMLPDRYDRSAYYVCLYGRAQKFFCPPGLKFDQHKPACVPNRYRLRRRSTGHFLDLDLTRRTSGTGDLIR